MVLTFSTWLTIARIIMIPFIAWSMILRMWIVAIILFSAAAITDMFDGYLARRWNEETVLGAYLDPLADKLLITTCYAVLVFFPVEKLVIPGWFLSVVLAKEVALLVGALYWGIVKQEIEIRPSWLGKLAMVVQSMLVGWVLVCSLFHWAPLKTFYCFIAVSLILVIGSLIHYMMSIVRE